MEQGQLLESAQTLVDAFERVKAEIQLVKNVSDLVSPPDGSDLDDIESKDPAVLQADVVAQTSYLRKLKFQYLEQNAKDRYIKTIVSDIDDAPIVSDEDNRHLQTNNSAAKEKLKAAKAQLAEVQNNIRTLAPLVEEDYLKAKLAAERAGDLAKKILDARLALARLRQTHPHPRLTVQAADQKLAEQVEEMQSLTDELENLQGHIKSLKHTVKTGALEVEGLRAQRSETEKNVKNSKADVQDDGRLVPLYDWYISSLAIHQSLLDLEEKHSASDNELRLVYNIRRSDSDSRRITIILVFQPNTHQLAAAQVAGLEELGVDIGDVLDAHVQMNDVHGLVAAILARAREGA